MVVSLGWLHADVETYCASSTGNSEADLNASQSENKNTGNIHI